MQGQVHVGRSLIKFVASRVLISLALQLCKFNDQSNGFRCTHVLFMLANFVIALDDLKYTEEE